MEIKNIVLIAATALFGAGFGWLVYRQYHEHYAVKVLLERIKEEHNRTIKSASCEEVEAAEVLSWSQVQTKLKNTVVQVFTHIAQYNWLEPYKTPNQGMVAGTAFFISETGDLITNAHVVNQAKLVTIQIPALGKRRFDVDVIGISPERDLALLRLKPEELEAIKEELGSIPFLTFGDSNCVYRAQEIMTLGYPLGQQILKSTTGVVSGREHMNGHYMIQISAPINHGNSGGPSINKLGEVVGVNTSGFDPGAAQNVNYIIPSNEVKLFLHQLEVIPADENGIKFLRKPYLGVFYNNGSQYLTDFLGNPRPGGLYVVDAYKNSPLQKAGILPGDMIYEINGHRIDTFGEMNVPWSEDKLSILDYISCLTLYEDLHLLVYRKGKAMTITLKFEPTELAAVRLMYPGYERMEYEIIGGMVIAPLSLNLAQGLLQMAPELARYMEPKNQTEPALIITHAMPDSEITRARNIGVGAVIKEVNGQEVKTLEDLRNALVKSVDNDYVTIKTFENNFSAFSLRKMLKDEAKLSRNYYYTITPFVQSLIERTAEHDKK